MLVIGAGVAAGCQTWHPGAVGDTDFLVPRPSSHRTDVCPGQEPLEPLPGAGRFLPSRPATTTGPPGRGHSTGPGPPQVAASCECHFPEGGQAQTSEATWLSKGPWSESRAGPWRCF